MRNPFSFSNIVTGEAFCNREQEQEDLMDLARNSQNVLLYSHRRKGKSSLIHKVLERLGKETPKVRSIYIDLYGSLSEQDFINALLSGLTQIESRIDKIFKMAAGLKLSGSLDPETGTPSISASFEASDKKHYLEKSMNILKRCSEKNKLVIVFDEFQEITCYSSEFEKLLRKEIQQHSNICYIFSGSQKHILMQMFTSVDRAFYKQAYSFPLKKIETPHYVKWAQALFLKKKVELHEDIVIEIVERCDHQPMYVQQFLYELWKIKEISQETVDLIEEQIITRRTHEYMNIWDNLTVNQKKVSRLLAKTKGESIFKIDSLNRTGFTSPSQVSSALKSLSDKGLIAKNGKYKIQDVMFRKWVLRFG